MGVTEKKSKKSKAGIVNMCRDKNSCIFDVFPSFCLIRSVQLTLHNVCLSFRQKHSCLTEKYGLMMWLDCRPFPSISPHGTENEKERNVQQGPDGRIFDMSYRSNLLSSPPLFSLRMLQLKVCEASVFYLVWYIRTYGSSVHRFHLGLELNLAVCMKICDLPGTCVHRMFGVLGRDFASHAFPPCPLIPMLHHFSRRKERAYKCTASVRVVWGKYVCAVRSKIPNPWSSKDIRRGSVCERVSERPFKPLFVYCILCVSLCLRERRDKRVEVRAKNVNRISFPFFPTIHTHCVYIVSFHSDISSASLLPLSDSLFKCSTHFMG